MSLLFKGARLVDPLAGIDKIADLLVNGQTISAVGEGLESSSGSTKGTGANSGSVSDPKSSSANGDDPEILDMSGKIIVPGLVDMHVHFRDPGQEYKEDIISGSAAAAHGGFTDVCMMPNTNPVYDNDSVVSYAIEKAAEAHIRVHPSGSLTKGIAGVALSEIGSMSEAGAVAFTDDGRGVQDNSMMRRAMDYVKMFDKTVMSHCQFEDLTGSGVVNEGTASTRLGLAPWPAAAEEIQIRRDIALCELTGCKLHIQHITTAEGLSAVSQAKKAGLPVTCEVTPHHLFLSQEDITSSYNTSLKVNPPLRTKDDCEALIEGLINGSIDCIASDHAPHALHEKALEFEIAPFGMVGLETSLSLVLSELVGKGRLSYSRVVELMSINPRRILGLPSVSLHTSSVADLTIIDPEVKWTVDESEFYSKSSNSGFIGRELIGRATDVYVAGRPAMIDGVVR